MTTCAVLIARAPHVVERRRLARQEAAARAVTFQAQRSHRGSNQHLRIIRSMRFMARLAIANAVRCVFEGEGSASVRVALHAGHLSGEAGPQLAPLQSSMRLVTVDAAHGIFGHAMMERLGKIGPLLNMAAQAERVRRRFQDPCHRSGLVHVVTVRAGKPALRVHRMIVESDELALLLVAGEALLVVGLRGLSREGDDLRLVTVTGCMSFAGPMARLTGVFHVVLRALFEDRMGSLVEGLGEVFMADRTIVLTNGARRLLRILDRRGTLGLQSGKTGGENPQHCTDRKGDNEGFDYTYGAHRDL